MQISDTLAVKSSLGQILLLTLFMIILTLALAFGIIFIGGRIATWVGRRNIG